MSSEGLGNDQVQGKPEPGEMARRKVLARRRAVRRALLSTYLFISFCCILFGVLGAALINKELSKPGVSVTDTRPCAYTDKDSGITLKGQRHYSYTLKKFGPYEYRSKDDVDYTTELIIDGSEVNIVGMTNDGWWGVNIGLGEKGVQKLDKASVYVVTSNKRNAVFNDSTFCR